MFWDRRLEGPHRFQRKDQPRVRLCAPGVGGGIDRRILSRLPLRRRSPRCRTRNADLFYAPISELDAPKIHWKVLCRPVGQPGAGLALLGGQVYAVTHDGRARGARSSAPAWPIPTGSTRRPSCPRRRTPILGASPEPGLPLHRLVQRHHRPDREGTSPQTGRSTEVAAGLRHRGHLLPGPAEQPLPGLHHLVDPARRRCTTGRGDRGPSPEQLQQRRRLSRASRSWWPRRSKCPGHDGR